LGCTLSNDGGELAKSHQNTFAVYADGAYKESSSNKHNDPVERRHKSKENIAGRNLWETKDWLETMVRRTQSFKELFSQAQATDRVKIQIPDELPKAWLHIIMALVYNTIELNELNDHMNMSTKLINEGMKKVVHSISRKSLLDKTTLLPFEITSLLNFRLLQDITGVHPDITETYSEYLKELVRAVSSYYLSKSSVT
jgi:hypothetical protein